MFSIIYNCWWHLTAIAVFAVHSVKMITTACVTDAAGTAEVYATAWA